MRRNEVSDEQWELIEPMLPVQRRGGRGRPRCDQRKMLKGMMWILLSGARWRNVPEGFGRWETVYHYCSRWRKDGVFDRILVAFRV